MKQDQKPVFIVDTREKPGFEYTFPGYQVIRGALKTGDVSCQGFESLFSIDRKEKNDMVNCVTFSRERFCRELSRADSMLRFWVLIEASIEEIERGEYRIKVSPAAVLGTLACWENRYNCRFIFAGNRSTANRTAERLLVHAWREITKPSSRTALEVVES